MTTIIGMKPGHSPAGARPYYERALAIFEKALGPEHPNSRVVRNNLAALIQSRSRSPRAATSIISRLKKILTGK